MDLTTLLLTVTVVNLTLWILLATDWFLGVRSMTRLDATTPLPTPPQLPSLSVIVPALNEERKIAQGLRSLLEQDYPGLELIVVNDRSTDRTGEILEALAEAYPQLERIHIQTLPDGWLGKTHALYRGAQRARGEWLLFTDADIEYQPGALSQLMSYALSRQRDHLAALPYFIAKGTLLRSFVTTFALLFSVYSQPWRAAKADSKAHIGVGAFTLVRKHVYEQIGTHERVALSPDEDMRLGKCIKRAGFRQEAIFAPDLMQVEWYGSLPEAIGGLSKNAFAGFDYSLALALIICTLLLITNVFPFGALFIATGLAWWLNTLIVLIVCGVYGYNARLSKYPIGYAALHPVGVTILVYAALASTFKALWRGEISWRGTRYKLRELKRNRV